MNFGEYFSSLRIGLGFTLRKFSEKFEEDPAYISRLERGRAPAPRSKEKLRYFAKGLGLKKGTEEYDQFFQLAAVSNKTYGIDEINNEKLLEKLPVFLRTLDNKGLDDKKLDELIELIRKA